MAYFKVVLCTFHNWNLPKDHPLS